MYELPLFPLNTVLFPGMPLPLRIFEPRYKEMIGVCIREKRPFGVVLIREGKAQHGPLAVPHTVGCTAQITQVEPLEDGQFAILSIGQERFRIHSLKKDKAYLVGMVENTPLLNEPETKLTSNAKCLRALVGEYLEILARASGQRFDAKAQVPGQPIDLIYLAASVLQTTNDNKQKLLSQDYPSQLLSTLTNLFSQEVALLRVMPKEDLGAFSVN